MIAAAYIVLGILVVGLVVLQVWIARASSPLAGDRSRLVYFVRMLNTVLVVVALALAVYTLLWK